MRLTKLTYCSGLLLFYFYNILWILFWSPVIEIPLILWQVACGSTVLQCEIKSQKKKKTSHPSEVELEPFSPLDPILYMSMINVTDRHICVYTTEYRTIVMHYNILNICACKHSNYWEKHLWLYRTILTWKMKYTKPGYVNKNALF